MGTGLKSYRQIKAEAAAKKGTSIASGANKKLGSYNISGRVSRYFGETDDITTALNKIDAAINSGDEAEADALISAEKTKIENLKTKGAAYYDPAVLSERADGYLNLLNSRFVDYEYETPETVTYTDSRSRTSHTEHVKKKTRKSAVQIERDYKQYVSDLKALDEDKTEYVTSGELYVTQKERLDDLISRGDELRAAFSAQGLTEAQGNVEGVVSSLKEGKTKLDDWRKTAGYSKTYFNMSDALSGEDGEDGKIDYNGGRYTRDEVSSAQETLADINKTYAGLSDRAAAFSARYVKGEKPDAEELEEFYNDVKALRGELSGLKEYTDVSDTRGYGRGLTGNAPEPTLKGSLLNGLISDYEKELDTLQNAAKDGSKLGYFGVNVWGGLKSAASGTGELLSEVTSQWSTSRSGRDIEDSYRYINNPEYAEAPKPEDYKISDEEYQKILSDKLGDLPEGYVPVGIDSTPTKEEYERHQYETALKKYNDTKNFAGENGDYINQIEVRDALILKSNAGEDNSVNVGQDKNFTEAMKALGTSDPEEMFSLLAEHYGNFSDEEKKAWRLLYSPSKAALALAAENNTESLAGLYGDGKSAKDILSDRYYIEDEYKRTYKTDTDALTDILNDGSVRNAFTLGNLTSADYEYLYDAYGISKEDVSSVSERFKTTIDTLKNDISYGNGLSDEFKELWGGAAQSIGMMLPATVSSLAGSLIPGVAGTIASSVLSGALFTAPVITTSYENAVAEGHTPSEAKTYAVIQGISEGATELLFSGFGNAANSVLGKLMAKTPVVKGILKTASRSTVGRIMANAMNIIGSSASEFGEEYLQQFLEPLYRNYAYGEDNTPEVFNRDNFKAGVAGAMVGALMSGFGVAVSNGSNAVSKARKTAAFNEKSLSQADIYESQYGKEIVDSVNLPDEMKKKTISPSEVLIDQAQGYGKKYGESSFSAQALAKAGITGDTKTLSYRQIAALETAVGRDAAYEALSGILEGEQAEQFIKEINSAPLSKELKNNIINYNSIDEVARTELKNNKRATDEIVDAIFYAGYDVRSPIVQERQKHILTRADQTTRIDVSPARTVQNMISRYRAVLSPVGIEVSEATVKPVNDNSKVRAASYFDSTENKIYYYQGITDAEAFNFKMAHELVEAINAKGDGSFVADVLEVMKGNGAYSEETIEKLRRRYMDFYYELYNKKDNDAGLFGQQYRDEARKRAEATVTVALAEKEAVCDYIGELARGGELLRSLESTAKQNTESGAKARNLLTRIYEAVKNFIKKFRRAGQHTSNIEYDDLVKLEKRLRSFVEAKTGSEVKRTGKTYEGKETRGYAVSDTSGKKYADYNKPITVEDVNTLRTIPRKSINAFTDEDIAKTQKWAYKFYKELGIKSPFFRRWFGDCREYDPSPITVVDIPNNDSYRIKLSDHIVENLDTKTDNQGKGWLISVSGHGERNTTSHSGIKQLSKKGLANIDGLVQNGILLDTESREHHSNNAQNDYIAFDHKFYALGKSDAGGIALYKITVEEYYQSKSKTNNKRFHNLRYIEKVADIPPVRRTFDKSHSGGSAVEESTTNYTVSDLFAIVKKYDENFNPRKAIPELVNPDGTPKMVYHGSYSYFTSFNDKKKHSGAPVGSHFFSDNKNVAYSYTGYKNEVNLDIDSYPSAWVYNVDGTREMQKLTKGGLYSCYLSMHNPFTVDWNGKRWNEPVSDYEDVNDAVLYAKQNKYDGIIIKNIVDDGGYGDKEWNTKAGAAVANNYVVFSPEQIKSATGNVGTFDDTDRIHYALSDTSEDADSKRKDAEDIREAREKAKEEWFAEFNRERLESLGDSDIEQLSAEEAAVSNEEKLQHLENKKREYLESLKNKASYRQRMAYEDTFGEKTAEEINEINKEKLKSVEEARKRSLEATASKPAGADPHFASSEANRAYANEVRASVREMTKAINKLGREAKVEPVNREKITSIVKAFVLGRNSSENYLAAAEAIYSAFAEFQKSNDSARLTNRVQEVVKGIIESEPDVSDEEYNGRVSELRKYFKDMSVSFSDTDVAEAVHLAGSWKEFRDRCAKYFKSFKQVKYDKNALSATAVDPRELEYTLDNNWAELHEQFPEYFDAGSEVLSNKVARFWEAVSSLEYRFVDVYDGQYDMAAELLAGDLITQIASSYITNPTYKQFSESVDSLRSEANSKYREIYERRLEEIKNDRRIDDISRKTEQILDAVNHPVTGSGKYIPDILVSDIQRIFGAMESLLIHGKKSRTYGKNRNNEYIEREGDDKLEYFEQEKSALLSRNVNVTDSDISEQQEFGETFFPTPYFISEAVDLFKSLGGKTLYQLDAHELSEVNKIMTVIRHVAQRIIEEKAFDRTLTIAEGGIKYIKSQLGGKPATTKKGKNRSLQDPIQFFDENGEVGEAIFSSLLKGTNEKYGKIFKALDFGKNTMKKLGFTAKEKTRMYGGGDNHKPMHYDFSVAKQVAKYDENNVLRPEVVIDTLRMSVPQIMSLYATYKRPLGKRHILKGGITCDAFDRGLLGTKQIKRQDVFKPTKEQLEEIFSKLTDKEKKLTDELVDFMSTECAKWGNDYTRERFGVSLFGGKYYYPITSNSDYITRIKEDGKEQQVHTLTDITRPGFSKSAVQDATNSIDIKDIFSVFSDHTAGMAAYSSMSAPICDAVNWYNYTEPAYERSDSDNGPVEKIVGDGYSVKGIMGKYHGSDAKAYFVQLMKDLNGDTGAERDFKFVEKMLTHAKKSSVSANLGVVALQGLAYFRAATVIPAKYMSTVGLKSQMKKAQRHSNIAAWKHLSFYDSQVDVSTKKEMFGKTNLENVEDKLGSLAGFADDFTWGCLWTACEKWVTGTTDLKYDSEEYLKEVARRFDDMVARTQVVDVPLFQAQILRNKSPFAKNVTAFMAEPIKTLSMVDMVINANRKYGFGRKFWGVVAKTGAVYTMQALTVALAQSLRDLIRDDEESYETTFEKFLNIFWRNIVDEMNIGAKIPILADVFDILKGYDNEPMYFQFFSTLYNAAKVVATNMSDYKNSDDKDLGRLIEWSSMYQLLRGVSYASGMPLSNVARFCSNIYRLATGNHLKKQTVAGQNYNDLYKAMSENNNKKEDQIKAYLIRMGKEDTEIETKLCTAAWNFHGNEIKASTASAEKDNWDMYKNNLAAIPDSSARVYDVGMVLNKLRKSRNEKRDAAAEDADKKDAISEEYGERMRSAINYSGLSDDDKQFLYSKFVTGTYEEDFAALNDAGVTMKEFFAAEAEYDRIYDEYKADKEKKKSDEDYDYDAPEKAFGDYLEEEGFNDDQIYVLKHTFVPGVKSREERLVKYGLDDKDAADAAYIISSAPMSSVGEGKVTKSNRAAAVGESDLDNKTKKIAMQEVLSDDQYKKLEDAEAAGVSVDEYIDYFSNVSLMESDKYTRGKKKGEVIPGSKKKKVVKYISSMDLDASQKLLLYELSGYQVKKGVRWRDVLNSIK